MAKSVGRFWNVREAISLFLQMGCELRSLSAPIAAPDGEDMNVRYLINPEKGRYVEIVDLEDDEFVPESEIAYWERRLGVEIPRPSKKR